MPRLTHDIPSWVDRYIGIEFRSRGRTRVEGLDCWGLVRLVYIDQLGVLLPALSDRYDTVTDAAGVGAAVAGELGPGGSGWGLVPAPLELGDVLLFRIAGDLWHVGVAVARHRMLHILRGTRSCHERFDAPTWVPRLEGVYRFTGRDAVRMVGSAKPFPMGANGLVGPAGGNVDLELPAGLTVAELLEAAGVPAVGIVVMIGHAEVPREAWGRVRPKAGRLVTIAARIEGGDGAKGVLRVIGTIAIIAAAAALQPWLVGASVGLTPLQAGLVVGAFSIGATLALSALVAPPQRRLSDGTDRASPTIQGGGNELRPYEPTVDVLGTHRLVPPYAAAPFTENVGDDQYLRCLFDCGSGPKDLDDLRIGDTPIEQFDGVEIEIRPGYPDDEPCRLFPNTVVEDSLSVLLEHAAGWTVRTTATDADEISVDISFLTGLARIASDGGREELTVGVDVEYSPAGMNLWARVNGDAGSSGSPVDARGLDLLFRTPEVQLGGTGLISTAGIEWGLGFAGAKPSYLPATNFSWETHGYFRDPDAPESGGDYTFSVDGSDAIDLEVDGRIVASWYGSHPPVDGDAAAPNFPAHAGVTVRLARGYHRIRVRVECRSTSGAVAVGWRTPTSGGAWAAIPGAYFRTQGAHDAGVAGLVASWYDTTSYTSTISTTAARTDPMRRTLAWAVPRGQYDVRLIRVTDDNNSDRILDDVHWTALRTIRNQDPVQLPGRAKVALRIKATDQLQGVIEQFNLQVTSIVPDWDAESGSWIERATSNPASLYRYVLQGRPNARPLADDRIDLAALEEWHEANDAAGSGGGAFRCNAVIDFAGTVYERLSDIASTGRASVSYRDGKISVVRDKPQTVPVQHFTPRNSWGFRGRKVFPDRPHGLRIRFLNELNGYQQDERVVLADGYQLGGKDAWGEDAPELPPASRFEAMELFGVTHPDQVFKHGRYAIAVAILRPELIEISADVENLACNRGDLVRVAHDVWGETTAVGARVVRLVVDTGDNLLGIVIDEDVTMDPAPEAYAVRVRLEDGSTWLRNIAAPSGGIGGIFSELTFTGPASPTEPRPKVGDLVMFGKLGFDSRELIVRSIEAGDDLSAKLTLVDASPAVHQADVGPIPDFDSGITTPPRFQDAPEDPIIDFIRSDDWVMVRDGDGSLQPRMVITLRRPSGTRPLPTTAEVLLRPVPPPPATPVGPWQQRPRLPILNNTITLDGVEVGQRYQIRLRVITPNNRASHWVETEHTVRGNVLPPPDVPVFDVAQLADGTRRYSWDLGVIPPDIDGVKIRYVNAGSSAPWELMFPLHTGILDPASPYESREPGSSVWRIGIKMVDTAGNESVNAKYVVKDLGAPGREDLVKSEDAGVLGWPGDRVDCYVSQDGHADSPAGTVLEAIDNATWDTLDDFGAATWDTWGIWAVAPRTPIMYTHTPMDLGVVMVSVPELGRGWRGQHTAELRTSEDGVAYTEWLDAGLVAGVAVRARYHQWRMTVRSDPSGGNYIAVIDGFTPQAYAPVVEQDFNDLDTSALMPVYRLGPGDFRLPVDAGLFVIVRRVSLTFNGMGAGWSWQMVDRDPTLGPRVQIFNPAGELADAVVDATVRGFSGA